MKLERGVPRPSVHYHDYEGTLAVDEYRFYEVVSNRMNERGLDANQWFIVAATIDADFSHGEPQFRVSVRAIDKNKYGQDKDEIRLSALSREGRLPVTEIVLGLFGVTEALRFFRRVSLSLALPEHRSPVCSIRKQKTLDLLANKPIQTRQRSQRRERKKGREE